MLHLRVINVWEEIPHVHFLVPDSVLFKRVLQAQELVAVFAAVDDLARFLLIAQQVDTGVSGLLEPFFGRAALVPHVFVLRQDSLNSYAALEARKKHHIQTSAHKKIFLVQDEDLSGFADS